jgi:hypothetical protein
MKCLDANRLKSVLSLVLLSLAALTAVATGGWGVSTEGMERWVAIGALALSVAWLGLHWPSHSRRWVPAVFFLAGCAMGSWVLLHSLAQKESNKLDDIAIETLLFEAGLSSLLQDNQCQGALAYLEADLATLPMRPALSLVVRSDLWNEAAAKGCVTSSELARARTAIRHQVETGPLGALGVEREHLLERIGPSAELESVGQND